ncbi:MAG TPA: SGNH/GDSL hydrolase family protein [Luteitalea sp.]|nr:SGNH/GDSL hydrolase family protein [Luteitalea sp.]
MTRRDVVLSLAGIAIAPVGGAATAAIRQAAAPATQVAPAADRWAKEIAAFEQDDAKTPFAAGGIVFVGSSSIRLWDLAAAFPGRRLLNRGFGGTQIIDSVQHVDRLVLRHKPATVVFYAGDNDLASKRTPQQVDEDFRAFVGKVHAALPKTRIAFVGIKPSLARWALIEQVRDANRRVRAFCDADDRLGFIDVDGPMLGWDGKPRADLFVKDGLHLSAKGYALWNVLTAPYLD